MEPKPSKSFSPREWRMIVTIIVILEAFIAYLSFIYADNKSALGYTSFAGTVISIILAVLAIGYTYGESIKQKNQTDTVANQIGSLNEVIKNIQTQSSALNSISEINDQLLGLSRSFTDGLSNTHHKVEEVGETVNKIFREFENPVHYQKIASNDLDKSFLMKLLLKPSFFAIDVSLIVIYYSLKHYNEKNGFMDKLSESSSIIVARILEYKDANSKETYSTGVTFGSVNALFQVLFSLNIIYLKEGKFFCEEVFDENIETQLLNNNKRQKGTEQNEIFQRFMGIALEYFHPHPTK